MANDFGQEQHTNYEAENKDYISLVEKNIDPRVERNEDFDYIEFPEKEIGQIGTATLSLLKHAESYDLGRTADLTAFVLYPMGLETIKVLDAKNRGLYRLGIDITNKLARFRDTSAFVHLSLNGSADLISAELYNESEDVELLRKEQPKDGLDQVVEETHLTHPSWGYDKDIQNPSGELYISYDPNGSENKDFLANLKFRFQLSQNPGGELN